MEHEKGPLSAETLTGPPNLVQVGGAAMQSTRNTPEQWKPVVGYEGSYEVSDHGNVRGLDRYVPDGRGGHRLQRGKKLKLVEDAQKRHVVNLRKDGSGKVFRVHTLVMEAFVGPRPDGMEVCHNDGDNQNNHVSNLRYDTHYSNYMDMFKHGTHYWANKDSCTRGHKYGTTNLLVHPRKNGKTVRVCKACHRTRSYISRHPEFKDSFDKISDQYYQSILRGK